MVYIFFRQIPKPGMKHFHFFATYKKKAGYLLSVWMWLKVLRNPCNTTNRWDTHALVRGHLPLPCFRVTLIEFLRF